MANSKENSQDQPVISTLFTNEVVITTLPFDKMVLGQGLHTTLLEKDSLEHKTVQQDSRERVNTKR